MIQPSSVDVRLDKFFRLFDNHKYPVIDPAQDQADLTRLVGGGPRRGLRPPPGEFVLGSTLETVSSPTTSRPGSRASRASAASGSSHATAGFVDPASPATSPSSSRTSRPCRSCCGPVKIGQLAFFRLSSSAENPYGSATYGSHYQGQRGPTASRSFQNFHRADV